MPKLTKFPLSKKNIVLLLIISSVPLAILAYPNFSQKTITEIKILDKQTYLEKYKEKDPIENTKIDKNNIIFLSETEIIDFLKEKQINISINDLNKNKSIVDYYHKKYKNENLSYIYFEQEKNILKKVFLFWDIKKIKKEPIDINIKESNSYINSKTQIFNLYHYDKSDKQNLDTNYQTKFENNSHFITKPLYYQNKIINAIYFDVENIDPIENDNIEEYTKKLLNFFMIAKKIILFNWPDNCIKKTFSMISQFYTNDKQNK